MAALTAPIVHPTDFSALSMNAFVHALKLSLAGRCRLYIVHIADAADRHEWHSFPHVRQTLTRWGLLAPNASPAEIGPRLGVDIAKVEITQGDPADRIARFLAGHPAEMMVLSTHGRSGLPRWVKPSVAEAMARRSHMQTLFIPEGCKGFVDPGTGVLSLDHVLLPVDHKPAPLAAIQKTQELCRLLGAAPRFHVLHVGTQAPVASISTPQHRQPVTVPIELRQGNVVEAILGAAMEKRADLLAMATAGRHGLLDALRGSTTEQVLREASCPVLAIPLAV